MKKYLLYALFFTLFACSESTETVTENPEETTEMIVEETTDTAPAPEETAPAEDPNRNENLCFQFSDPTLDEIIRLEIKGGTVTGTRDGTVHDEAQGYFTSYASTISGIISGDKLTISLKTEIEGDVQNEEAEWTLVEGVLNDGRHAFTAFDCNNEGGM